MRPRSVRQMRAFQDPGRISGVSEDGLRPIGFRDAPAPRGGQTLLSSAIQLGTMRSGTSSWFYLRHGVGGETWCCGAPTASSAISPPSGSSRASGGQVKSVIEPRLTKQRWS